MDKILPSIYKILAALGFATGTIINTTTDVAADGTRAAVDVVEGSIQSVGNMLQKASSGSLDLNIGKKTDLGSVTSDKSSSKLWCSTSTATVLYF